jgi:hypothetical protein
MTTVALQPVVASADDRGAFKAIGACGLLEIREAIMTRGWSDAKQAYAQSFDSDDLDTAQPLRYRNEEGLNAVDQARERRR